MTDTCGNSPVLTAYPMSGSPLYFYPTCNYASCNEPSCAGQDQLNTAATCLTELLRANQQQIQVSSKLACTPQLWNKHNYTSAEKQKLQQMLGLEAPPMKRSHVIFRRNRKSKTGSRRRSKSREDAQNRLAQILGLCCLYCGATETPEWRRGPDGLKSLCNACGLHYAKMLKVEKERKESQTTIAGGKVGIDMLLN